MKQFTPPRADREIDVNQQRNWFTEVGAELNKRLNITQDDSTATTVEQLVQDLNTLISQLKGD